MILDPAFLADPFVPPWAVRAASLVPFSFFRQLCPETSPGRRHPARELTPMTLDPGRVQSIFLAALEQESPADRIAVLDRECAADDELRRGVEALLISH